MNKNYYNELMENISSDSQQIYDYIESIPENSGLLYLKLDFLKIHKLYENYTLKIETLIFNIKKINIDQDYFKKLINLEIENILKNNEEIYSIIYTIYLKIKKEELILNKLNNLLKKNERSIQILHNMSYGYKKFNYIIDINKIKNINYTELKTGDIVVTISQKHTKFFSDPLNWLIYKITRSNIVHATIYSNKTENNYYFFDTISRGSVNLNDYQDYFKKKFLYRKLKKDYNSNSKGLVLRLNRKLTEKEKEKIDEFFRLNEGKEYGLFKALYLGILLELFYYFPKDKYLKNKVFKNTYYCSENVVLAYEYSGIILSLKEDPATTTPVDLLNSTQLKIIGYIDKPQK